METFKPTIPSRGRAALLATAFLIVPLHAGETQRGSSLAASEQSRRSVAIDEARELLRKGDEAYQNARYSDAVQAYAGARELIPNAPISAELRAAATQRYAQASVEHARILSRKGDVAGAKAAVDKVLITSVAPDNPGALAFRAELDDPIRTNPALTAEHAKNVDAVRRLLYTAEGAFNLGKYDQAKSEYQNVLRIDPTNSAARRGLEKVASAKTSYYRAAGDQARAEILGQVDAAWETQVPPLDFDLTLAEPSPGGADSSFIPVSNKLDRIIIPTIALDQANLEEALEFLRFRAAENDTTELDPAKKGVNFAVNLGDPDSEVAIKIRSLRFDLRVSQVPLGQALKYVTDMTQTSFTTDDFAVIIKPLGAATDDLVSRTYRVPSDFISNLSGGGAAAGAAANDDPFGAAPAGTGLLAQRMGAQEALAKQGVNFPEGASANYSPSNNTLRVVNTPLNQDYIAQIIETITQTEPVVVVVRVTMIRVERNRLEELGFDWLLNPIPLDSGGNVFASGGTVGNTPGRTGSDMISPVNGTAIDSIPADPDGQVTSGMITNGNRSGSTAIQQNSIEDLIANPNRSAQTSAAAPGVLAVTGLFTDGQVQTLMRGLDQKKGVDLMAKPSIVTRSGQASSIVMVREFIYPTEYEPPELPNSVGRNSGGSSTPVTPATPTAFDTKDLGISLEVLPVVDANKQYIDVTLNPIFSDFDGFVNYGSPINSTQNGLLGPETVVVTENTILMPVFSKQTLSTNVQVADGGTIVLGGMLRESIQNVQDKTPILGDIPIIGRLFQSSARQPTSTAILFLVNVELLDPTGRPFRNQ
jgi:general secretion pathway protein D